MFDVCLMSPASAPGRDGVNSKRKTDAVELCVSKLTVLNRSAPVPFQLDDDAVGMDTPMWLAMLPDDGPSGGLFANREPSAWQFAQACGLPPVAACAAIPPNLIMVIE